MSVVGTIAASAAYPFMTDDFSESCERALQRFMAEFGITDRDKAMRHIVRDWLVSHGYTAVDEEAASSGETSEPDPEFVQYPSYYKNGGSL